MAHVDFLFCRHSWTSLMCDEVFSDMFLVYVATPLNCVCGAFDLNWWMCLKAEILLHTILPFQG